MFNKCPECGIRYLFKSSVNKCIWGHRRQDYLYNKNNEHYFKLIQHSIKMNDIEGLQERLRLSEGIKMQERKITQREWEQAEARDIRNNRKRHTPTSNSILDGTVYTGGYNDYSSNTSTHHSSNSHSHDSGSSCDSSSSSSSSCDF